MTLTYAVRLSVQELSGNPAPVRRIADLVGQWARIPDPLRPATQLGRKDASVTTEVFGDPDRPPWAWRLKLSHPDEEDPAVQWSVSVEAVAGPNSIVVVRLDRTRTDGVVAKLEPKSGPPACIRYLLDDDELVIQDGGQRLGTSIWVVRPDQAEELAGLIASPDRRFPIFAFTPRDEEVIDGGAFLTDVVGLAHVVYVKSDTSWRLGDLLPRGFNVYGGAARIWWPRISVESNRLDHPLWTSDREASVVVEEALSKILVAGLATAVSEPLLTKLEEKHRARLLQDQIAEIAAVGGDQEELIAGLQTILNDDDQAFFAEGEVSLGLLIGAVLQQKDREVDAALAMVRELEETASAARERLGILQSRLQRAEVENERLQAVSGGLAEIDDDSLLHDEISRMVDQVRSRGERAKRRDFTIGPLFSERLEMQGRRYRSTAIRVSAEVISGVPKFLKRRKDHAMRTGSSQTAPEKFREDGAAARRCYLEKGVAAARRLHYWLLPDGSVELASVNVHDDFTIP